MAHLTRPSYPELFERIERMRKARGVTLDVMVKRLGGSINTWSQRLRSKHLPTYLDDIAKACGVNVEWLRGKPLSETVHDGMAIPLVGQVTAGDGWANPSQDPDDGAHRLHGLRTVKLTIRQLIPAPPRQARR